MAIAIFCNEVKGKSMAAEGDYPKLMAWIAGIAARPAVVGALAAVEDVRTKTTQFDHANAEAMDRLFGRGQHNAARECWRPASHESDEKATAAATAAAPARDQARISEIATVMRDARSEASRSSSTSLGCVRV